MVVYLDLAFLANALADALSFYLTAKLSSLPVKRKRILFASLLGGIYGALCLLPPIAFLGKLFFRILTAAVLSYVVFGRIKVFLRIVVMYYLVSCMLGGMFFSSSQTVIENGLSKTMQQVDWKAFILVSVGAFFLLSVIFRGSMKHAVFGEILLGKVRLNGREAALSILLDTGHSLRDPYNGAPVLTVWYLAAESLFTGEEWKILKDLEITGCGNCYVKLSELTPGKFMLLPYRAVGVESALLLAFRCDTLSICGKTISSATIALSPTSLSDGGGFVALWGEDLSNDTKFRIGCADLAGQAGSCAARKDHVYRWKRHTAAAFKTGGRGADAGENGSGRGGCKTNSD